ncbi:hypothetical protein N6H18_12445 [Reichenbachiella agarivorans]|uniref:VWFA domain-containing protein n=1 Tax=Reichenbachiella agarivorans TaxID=2979464 RepID=A0ABY6CKW9_9BACT|nr:hypothetical protein [Reichenbachiella agarivorans]UXP31158.1 hypothetical protein N6H18_12445 [Reichenbachiella agarivorans]
MMKSKMNRMIKMKNLNSLTALLMILLMGACSMPVKEKKEKVLRAKHNYIVLLDLSDRLITREDQPERDKQIVKQIYTMFEAKVKKELYVKSRDEIKVVIAPQRGSNLDVDTFEDELYVNMESISNIHRKAKEEERRDSFYANVDELYKQAVFSKNREDYHGADIWKYFYEDLKVDYVKDSLSENYLFILTDGYPIVGKNQNKLNEITSKYPGLQVVLMEAAPRDKDMEWDRVMDIWKEWFDKIGVEKYTLIKRGAITKELEQLNDLIK